MRLMEFTQALRDTLGGAKGRALLQQAIEAKRMDLIQTCFQEPHIVSYTQQAVGALPDDEFRQRVTIMMLRTPNPYFWHHEETDKTVSGWTGVGERNEQVEPFASIPKLLPEIKDLAALLKTQTARLKLADEMEAVINARKANLPSAAQGTLPESAKSSSTSTRPLQPSANRVSTPQSKAGDQPAQQVEEPVKADNATYWLVGGLAALAVLIWRLRPGKTDV